MQNGNTHWTLTCLYEHSCRWEMKQVTWMKPEASLESRSCTEERIKSLVRQHDRSLEHQSGGTKNETGNSTTDPCATCTTRRRASASLQARLGNPSQTCFHAKQAARSRRVSHADLPPSVLWCNRQTEACLVLRPKPKNYHGDFDAQITKPELPVLRSKPGNPTPSWF
jgi:hypothetical protein